ncbi:MAG: hypothetical protein QW158_03015 [Nitrososphaerales archaeon]
MKMNYANFDQELKRFVENLKCYGKPPVAHISVEGKEINRQRVQQALDETLIGKVLHFRPQIVEEAEEKLIELKASEVNIHALMKEYLKDEKIAEFGYDLFKVLRFGDVEEAKHVAEDYFGRMRQDALKESQT